MAIEHRLYDAVEWHAFQHILNNVINAVVAQLLTYNIQFGKKFLQDLTFASVVGYHVENDDIFLLAVAMDSTHALFQTVGIPGYIPVDKQPAELKVDAFSGSISTNQNLCLWGHELALGLAAFIHRHAAVNGGHSISVVLQSLLKIKKRILMLGKDNQFFTIDDTLGS